MAKKKQKNIKNFLKPIHLHAAVFLFFYFIFSNAIFISLVSNPNIYLSTLGPFVFGVSSAFVFIYLFGHEDFFSFMGELEVEERKKEKSYITKFIRHGRFIASVLVSQVGGPVFLALTVRFLYRDTQERYLIALLAIAITTLFGVAVAKGFLSFVI